MSNNEHPSLIEARPDHIVTVFGREYNLTHWPYGSLRPWYFNSDEDWLKVLIDEGISTARLLYMRGIYTAGEMEEHMDAAIETPLFGALCPHRVLPDNCSQCCGCEPEWWMKP